VPSEGKPQPIDTAVIAAPSDVPTTDLGLLADRRERHTARIAGQAASDGAGDVLAALALGAAMRRVVEDQEQHLVRDGLRHGATWGQLADALGVTAPVQARAAYTAWAQQLPGEEAAEALHLAERGEGA